jgi:hypothetical protein
MYATPQGAWTCDLGTCYCREIFKIVHYCRRTFQDPNSIWNNEILIVVSLFDYTEFEYATCFYYLSLQKHHSSFVLFKH